jgi:hypothetical protein
VFAGWSGAGCSGTATTCEVTMNTDESVTATFNSGGGGGQSVTLSGSPESTGGGVRDTVKCSAPGGQICQVTQTLATTETIGRGKPIVVGASAEKKNGRKHQTVVVGAKTETIAAGRTAKITIKLNRAGHTLLRRLGKLPVTLTVTLTDNGYQLTVSHWKVTIKPPGSMRRTTRLFR